MKHGYSARRFDCMGSKTIQFECNRDTQYSTTTHRWYTRGKKFKSLFESSIPKMTVEFLFKCIHWRTINNKRQRWEAVVSKMRTECRFAVASFRFNVGAAFQQRLNDGVLQHVSATGNYTLRIYDDSAVLWAPILDWQFRQGFTAE